MNTPKLPPLPALPRAEVEEWSESGITFRGEGWTKETVEKYATDYALAAIEAKCVPDVADLIAGALYDFLGHLTSLKKPISLGETEWATPAVDSLVAFAEKRRLTLNNPAIENWSAMLASAPPAPQAKRKPLSDPLRDDIHSVLFEVKQAIKNGSCPWQIQAAFEAYEAARRLQQPAHGIKE